MTILVQSSVENNRKTKQSLWETFEKLELALLCFVLHISYITFKDDRANRPNLYVGDTWNNSFNVYMHKQ